MMSLIVAHPIPPPPPPRLPSCASMQVELDRLTLYSLRCLA
jgi:hypothetical protein